MIDLATFLSLSLTFISLLLLFTHFLSSSSSPPTTTPCPQSYPLVGNLPGLLRNRHRFHDWVTDMLSTTPSSTLQVNSFLHLSPPGICTANPANLSHLLSSNFPNYVKGSRFNANLGQLLGHGIFNSDGQLWSTQRKIASHVFNTRSLKLFISQVVNSEIRNSLLPYLTKASNEGLVFDFQEFLQQFTFKNLCKVAFGLDEVANSNNFLKDFDDAAEIVFSRLLSPVPVLWKMKRLFGIGSERKLKECIRKIDQFAYQVIKSKEEKWELQDQDRNAADRDLLSRFMLLSSEMEFISKEDKRKFLRDIIISFVLAGKDSTSTALTWFFWLVAGHPRCKDLIGEELDSSGDLREDPVSGFNYAELKRLDYLHAALSESMRLFPPVPINSRLALNDDVLPDGTRVKKGWFADYSAYAMGRNEGVWGPDYKEFKPERWLGGGGGGVDDRERLKFQPCDQFRYPVFHCGPRSCLGKEMAYIQMKAIAGAVMREFEVLPVDGGGSPGRMVDPPYVITVLLKMRGGLPVTTKGTERQLAHS